MNENWEIVIGTISGTISGFLIATFADIVKGWLQRRIEHNRLRDMLYQEVLNNHKIVQSLFPKLSHSDLISIIRFRLSIEGYEFVKANHIALFYELREASCFNQLYSICKQLQSVSERTPKVKIEKLTGSLFSAFVHFIETGALDQNRFDKLDKRTETKTVYKWTG